MKLTNKYAASLVVQAHINVEKYQGYRFGQALWNLLPEEIRHQCAETSMDFFEWEDPQLVCECFYANYVSN